MKNTTPACPHCETNKYVVRERSMEKAGTLLGGSIGAGSACAGICTTLTTTTTTKAVIIGITNCLKPMMAVTHPVANGVLSILHGALLGFMAGSATGHKLGELIDTKIRMKYRCKKCGCIL